VVLEGLWGSTCLSAVCVLVIGRLLQQSQCTEATLTDGAAVTDATAASRELPEDDNRSSDGAGAVINSTSASAVADPCAGQSGVEHQTSQLAAGASRLWLVLIYLLVCTRPVGLGHSLANRDSCPTPAKSGGIEYLQSWTHRN